MLKKKRHIDETAKKERAIFRPGFVSFFFSIIFLLFVNANVLIVTHSFANPMWNVDNFLFFF